MNRISRVAAACLLLALIGSLAACGDGGEQGGVATLSNGEAASADDEGGGGGDSKGSENFEDAMLEFAKCMRENGVDMPDPTFDGEGGGPIIARRSVDADSNSDSDGGGDMVAGAVAGAPFEVGDGSDFEKANEACKPLLDEAMKDAPKPSAEEMAEMQDRMLEYAECMREHGVDMPDPTFDGEGGGFRVAVGGPTGGSGGGAAPDDKTFKDAAEACQQEGGPGGITMTPGASVRVDGDGGDDE